MRCSSAAHVALSALLMRREAANMKELSKCARRFWWRPMGCGVRLARPSRPKTACAAGRSLGAASVSRSLRIRACASIRPFRSSRPQTGGVTSTTRRGRRGSTLTPCPLQQGAPPPPTRARVHPSMSTVGSSSSSLTMRRRKASRMFPQRAATLTSCFHSSRRLSRTRRCRQ
jgi:hypothetical protein